MKKYIKPIIRAVALNPEQAGLQVCSTTIPAAGMWLGGSLCYGWTGVLAQ